MILNDNDINVLNELTKYNEQRKAKGLKKLTLKEFKDLSYTNEGLRNNGENELTYEQYYHTTKDYQYIKDIESETKKANYIDYMNFNRELTEFEQLQKEYLGSFCFNFYSSLLTLNIGYQYLFRFAYLCTFIGWNDNKIYFGKSNNGLATETDLKEILNLKKDTFIDTKKVFLENKLIFINEDKTVTINKKYCRKGNINCDLRGGIKMFEYGIKELYENSKSTEHKRLGMLMQILPTVNYEYNVLCAHPTETDENKIIPLTLKDICRIVGYEENQSSRLKRELLKIKVNGYNVICIHLIGDTNAISINPMVYYKGHNPKTLKYLLMLFKIVDNK